MSTAELELKLLEDARARILDPARWTQGTEARDAQGKEVCADDMRAVCWCAIGSMQRSQVELDIDNEVHRRAYRTLVRFCRTQMGNPSGVVAVNDDGDHARIIAAFDAAIADLKARVAAAGIVA